MAALYTGQLPRLHRMPGEKSFFTGRPEHRMTLRANIGRMAVVVPCPENAEGNCNHNPKDEWPPDPFQDPQQDGCDLQDAQGNPAQDHIPVHRIQFLFAFHNRRYVTDGFDGE